jgi:Peptidase S24-like
VNAHAPGSPRDAHASDVGALITDTLRRGVAVEFAVTGTSMTPLLRPGDVLTVAPAAAAELARGDVALFTRDGALTAHRVIATAPLVTRGDACRGADGEIAAACVLGRVVAFRRRGVRVRLDAPAGVALTWLCRAWAAARQIR